MSPLLLLTDFYHLSTKWCIPSRGRWRDSSWIDFRTTSSVVGLYESRATKATARGWKSIDTRSGKCKGCKKTHKKSRRATWTIFVVCRLTLLWSEVRKPRFSVLFFWTASLTQWSGLAKRVDRLPGSKKVTLVGTSHSPSYQIRGIDFFGRRIWLDLGLGGLLDPHISIFGFFLWDTGPIFHHRWRLCAKIYHCDHVMLDTEWDF